MLKTKQIWASYENYGKADQKHKSLDENINEFIQKEGIEYKDLIDIKFIPIGNELESTALIIYLSK